jgi:hypothetical protein
MGGEPERERAGSRGNGRKEEVKEEEEEVSPDKPPSLPNVKSVEAVLWLKFISSFPGLWAH